MKKTLLSLVTLLLIGYTNSQVIFSVEDPGSIQGSYDMEYAPAGADWAVMVDLLDPAEAILDTLVLFEDGTAADSLGCFAAANPLDVENKIAVLYRGDCEFGTKALNAQQAGALAVVIINNAPGGPVGMAAGTDGPSVTIPTVMIGDTDGAIIVDEMKNGFVEVFIGNKTGFYPNDVGTTRQRVERSRTFGVHNLLAQDDTDFSVEVGAWVFNYGFNDITGVNLQATIEHDGIIIYDEIGQAEDILSGDSLYFSLPLFSQTNYDLGYYDVTYTVISDSTEDYAFDNEVSADFAINDEYFSYSSLDPDDLSLLSPGVGRANTDPGQSFESCITFVDANASRVAATGLSFSGYAAANSETLPNIDGVPLSITVSRWDNQFTDLDDPGFNIDQIVEIAQAEFFFDGDVQGIIQTAEFDDPIVFDDDQRYLFCISTLEQDLFFGFDRDISYELPNLTNRQPLFPLVVNDEDFFALGFGENTVPAFGVNLIDAAQVNLQNEQLAIKMNAYPSPANSNVTVDFSGHEVESVDVMSLTGQVVASQNVSEGQNTTNVDVNGLENGLYIFKVNLKNGLTHKMNVVVSH